MNWYVDSSAILSIIFEESEAAQISPVFKEQLVTSELSRVEVLRTVTKTAAYLLPHAEKLLAQFSFIRIEKEILHRASSYPAEISAKTLDAIHLATAEVLSSLVNGVVTLDKQMAKNAEKLNLRVFKVA